MLHSRILRSPHQETAPHLCLTHFSHTVLIIGNTQQQKSHKQPFLSSKDIHIDHWYKGKAGDRDGKGWGLGWKGLGIGTERAGDWDRKGWGSGRKGLGIGTERAGDRDGKGCY